MNDSEFEEENSNLEILLSEEDALDSAVAEFIEDEEFSDFRVPVLAPGQQRPNSETVWVNASDLRGQAKSGLEILIRQI